MSRSAQALTEVRESGPWCGRCGHEATLHHATLDPRRPIVTCGRQGAHRVGCGRVVGTFGYHEAHAVSVRWRRRFASNLHARHARYEWTDLYCDGCVAAGWATRDPDFGNLKAARWADQAAPEGGP